ncbi:hypothetical protein [Enterococcus sp. DIV1368e]|uniref:hypothetical protein n=1 Tax=Enterococcus sp. DIV1368e TaxID=2774799 RepID=UPI003F277AFB
MKTVYKMTVKSALLMSLVAIVLASIDVRFALIIWGGLFSATLTRESFKIPKQKRPTSDCNR